MNQWNRGAAEIERRTHRSISGGRFSAIWCGGIPLDWAPPSPLAGWPYGWRLPCLCLVWEFFSRGAGEGRRSCRGKWRGGEREGADLDPLTCLNLRFPESGPLTGGLYWWLAAHVMDAMAGCLRKEICVREGACTSRHRLGCKWMGAAKMVGARYNALLPPDEIFFWGEPGVLLNKSGKQSFTIISDQCLHASRYWLGLTLHKTSYLIALSYVLVLYYTHG